MSTQGRCHKGSFIPCEMRIITGWIKTSMWKNNVREATDPLCGVQQMRTSQAGNIQGPELGSNPPVYYTYYSNVYLFVCCDLFHDPGNRSSAAMGVEGGMKCVKFLLFFFNFIFWLCGLALIVLGILVQVAIHNTFMIQDVSASVAPLVIIIVGIVIFFIAFFGCCGAWKENHCMVTTFAILLFLLILVEIAAAIAGYHFRGRITEVVQNSLTEMITRYNNSTDEFRKAVDNLQKDLTCCGANSSSDWRNFMPDGNSVPDSCCVNITAKCGVGAMLIPSKVHQEGCHTAMELLLKENIMWVIVAVVVIAVLQILGIVFSCLLMRGIRSGYEVM